jgi:hypothetical protein
MQNPDESGESGFDSDQSEERKENKSNCSILNVCSEIENYYHKNFKAYPLLKLKDYGNEESKIWKVTFDQTFDIIYLYKANITVYYCREEHIQK